MPDSTPDQYAWIIAADVRPGQWIALPDSRDHSDEWLHVETVQVNERSVRMSCTARGDVTAEPHESVVLHCRPFGVPVTFDEWAPVDLHHATECLELIEALTAGISYWNYSLSAERAQFVDALARRALAHPPVMTECSSDVTEYLPSGQPR